MVQVVVGGVLLQAWLVPPAVGVAVAVYLVIGLPPSLLGGVQEAVTDLTPAVAVTPMGASGGLVGGTGGLGVEAGPGPGGVGGFVGAGEGRAARGGVGGGGGGGGGALPGRARG